MHICQNLVYELLLGLQFHTEDQASILRDLMVTTVTNQNINDMTLDRRDADSYQTQNTCNALAY
jgi:hypothetical protein